jgi:hypothetical protein
MTQAGSFSSRVVPRCQSCQSYKSWHGDGIIGKDSDFICTGDSTCFFVVNQPHYPLPGQEGPCRPVHFEESEMRGLTRTISGIALTCVVAVICGVSLMVGNIQQLLTLIVFHPLRSLYQFQVKRP